MEVLRSLVPMPIGLSNKSPIFYILAILPMFGFVQETLAFLGWGSTPQTGSDVVAPFADWLISWKKGVPDQVQRRLQKGQKQLKPHQDVQFVPGHTRKATSKRTNRLEQY